MERTPIIIDSDMALGSSHADIDDAIAILLALDNPSLDVLAITGSGGNVSVDHSCRNIDRLLKLLGKSDIPHCFSMSRPLDATLWVDARWRQQEQEDILGQDCSFTSSDLIRKTLRESSVPITLISLGPLTNIALALVTEPELCKKVRKLVMMGGSFRTPGVSGGPAEFNIKADPEAAALVMCLPIDILMFGLDVTKKKTVRPEDIVQWDRGDSPFLRYLHDASEAFMHFRAKRDGYDEPYAFFHDALPVIYLSNPELFEMVPCSISVDTSGFLTRGVTVIDTKILACDARHQYAADVDEEKVFSLILNRVSDGYRDIKGF